MLKVSFRFYYIVPAGSAAAALLIRFSFYRAFQYFVQREAIKKIIYTYKVYRFSNIFFFHPVEVLHFKQC